MSEKPADPQPAGIHDTLRLVESARSGDRGALEGLFERYLPRVRRIVALRLGRRLARFVELEDIAQEVLLRVFRGLERFEARTEGSFRNWIATCVEHAIIDSARRMDARKRGSGDVVRFGDPARDESLLAILVDPGPRPSTIVSERETEERIEDALLELPTHNREIIVLRYLCGMSFAEISQTLEIGSEATARKALHRAVERLRGLLDG